MLETIVRVSSSKYSCVREALTAAAETDYVLPTNTVRTLGLKLLTCSQLHHNNLWLYLLLLEYAV